MEQRTLEALQRKRAQLQERNKQHIQQLQMAATAHDEREESRLSVECWLDTQALKLVGEKLRSAPPLRIKAYVPHTPLRATPPHHTGGLL